MATPTKASATNAVRHAATHGNYAPIPHWLTHLGGLGLFFVAILDSSPIPLPLPGSADLLLLLLVSHRGNPFLLTAYTVAGSAIGGYASWSAGKKGGEALLRRSVPAPFRDRIEKWTNRHSILSVLLPTLLPPPIPLMPFLLAAGALGVSRRRFLVAFNFARLVRYSLISWAGVVYGRKVVGWWTKNLSEWSGIVGWSFAALLIAAAGFGLWRYRKQKRRESGERAFA